MDYTVTYIYIYYS